MRSSHAIAASIILAFLLLLSHGSGNAAEQKTPDAPKAAAPAPALGDSSINFELRV